MNLGDDEESPVVCCAMNHGDQLSKLQNPKFIKKTQGVLKKIEHVNVKWGNSRKFSEVV